MTTHSAPYKLFQARLRQARLARGLTQKEAAKAIGTYEAKICRMETGERRVDLIELIPLAKLYKKSLKWFAQDSW